MAPSPAPPTPLPPPSSSPPLRFRAPKGRVASAAAPPLPRAAAALPLHLTATSASTPLTDWSDGSRSRSVPPLGGAEAAVPSSPFPQRQQRTGAGEDGGEPGEKRQLSGGVVASASVAAQAREGREAGEGEGEGEGEAGVEGRGGGGGGGAGGCAGGGSAGGSSGPFPASSSSPSTDRRQPPLSARPLRATRPSSSYPFPSQLPVSAAAVSASASPFPPPSVPRWSSTSSSSPSSSTTSTSRRRFPSSAGSASDEVDSGSGGSDGSASPDLSSLSSSSSHHLHHALPSPPLPHHLAVANRLRSVFPMEEAGEAAAAPAHRPPFLPPSHSAFPSAGRVTSASSWPDTPHSHQLEQISSSGGGMVSMLPYEQQLHLEGHPTPPADAQSLTAVGGSLLLPFSAASSAGGADGGEGPLHSSALFPSLTTSQMASAGSTRSSTPTSTSSHSGSTSPLADDPDQFTASSWHSVSAACLLRATEAVDVCCHAIVATNGRFHHSSSVTLESRRLALTVAVFERSLYAYALRISNARQQQMQMQRSRRPHTAPHSNGTGGGSNASSSNTTPTLAPSAPASVPPLPALYPHAPFVPQQGDYHEVALPPPDWSQSHPPLSYASTIPSSTAHSLAASAMATSSRLQHHALQQHQRFMQHHNHTPHHHQHQQAINAHNQQPRTSHPHTAATSTASFSPSSASPSLSSPYLPLSAAALPSLSISPVVSTSFYSPASPIPPTVSIPPSQWGGQFRSSSSLFHSGASSAFPSTASAAAAPPPLDPTSIPSMPVHAPGQQYRSRTFSASALHSSHAPASAAPQSHVQASLVPLSSPSPYPRSQSPVELSLSSLQAPTSVTSPLQDSRSLLLLHPPSASAAPFPSSSSAPSQPLTASAPPSSGGGGWHQPAGMSCLLRILTQQLLETRTVLLRLNDDCSSFPRYLRHLLQLTVAVPPQMARSLVHNPAQVMMAASLASLLSLLHSAPPLQRVREVARRSGGQGWLRLTEQLSHASRSSAVAFLLSFIPPSIQSSVLTLAAVLSPHVLLPQLRSAVHTRAAFTIVPLCLWLVYRLSRYRRIAHLRALHSRLGLLLRLWHICFSLLDQPQSGGAVTSGGGEGSGGGRLVDDASTLRPFDADERSVLGNRESARVPISRWLLELVPPELDASFWYHSSSFRLSLVKYGLDVLYSSVQEWWRMFGCRSVGWPYLLLAAAFYAAQPHLAASTASRLMAAPDLSVVRHAWRLLDTPVARKMVIKALPAIAHSSKLAVCREMELLDLDESEQHRRQHQRRPASRRRTANAQSPDGERGSGTGPGGGGGGSDDEDEGRFEVELSPSQPSDRVLRFDASRGAGWPPHRQLRRYQRAVSSRLRESLSSLDDEAELAGAAEPSLKVLLLSARPLRLTVNLRFHRVPSHSHVRSLRPSSSPVVLYFHGGGFFTDFRASHLHFLSQWASDLDVPILYVDYSLAPDNAYPTALNECYAVYRWVVEGRLGLNADRVVLVGDSTGANLAAATCMKAIIDGCRVPDAVVLACPILNLRLTPTPSRSLYMMDAVLPMNLLLLCRSLYLQGSAAANDADIDPCLSPIVASDLLLKQWPTTSIMVGGFDPFVDDAVDFAHRLAHNQVPVRLKVYDQLPHSFWDFAPLLPQAQHAVHLAATWIQSAFSDAHNNRDTDQT